MSAFHVVGAAAAAVTVSLILLVFLGRRVPLAGGQAHEPLCRLDPVASAGAAWCAECGG